MPDFTHFNEVFNFITATYRLTWIYWIDVLITIYRNSEKSRLEAYGIKNNNPGSTEENPINK